MKNKILVKRLILGFVLGIILGLICFAGFSSSPDMPAEFVKYQVWAWDNLWMWNTIINRFILGIVIALGGFIVIDPVLGWKIPSWFRGAKIGILLSLPMALGALMGENQEMAKNSFWIIMIFGMVGGMLIDIIITKFSGDGEKLIK